MYPKNQLIPTLIVFICSAVWHGIYVTYYIGFLHWALVTNISKFFYKASYKFGRFEGTMQLKIVAWIVSNLFMNYIGMHIVMLNLTLGLAYYNSIYWFGTIIILSVYTFFSITHWGQRSPKAKAKIGS
jgi:hypothetical protein